jgi:peptidoglycan/xylan/chitin deacetylase (PgdA/CDA1 family)
LRLASISVDLDEIPNYFEIHGLSAPEGRAATLVYDVALTRLRALAEAGGFPLTLFTIGSDVARREASDGLRDAAAHGHEIANHSLDHRYDLVRLGREEITRQIAEGARVIEEATGQKPVGFRAPGYTISDEVFDVLGELSAPR